MFLLVFVVVWPFLFGVLFCCEVRTCGVCVRCVVCLSPLSRLISLFLFAFAGLLSVRVCLVLHGEVLLLGCLLWLLSGDWELPEVLSLFRLFVSFLVF